MPAVASETSLEMLFLHILATLHIAVFFSLFFEAKQEASAWKTVGAAHISCYIFCFSLNGAMMS